MLILKIIFITLIVLSLAFILFSVICCINIGARAEKESERYFEYRESDEKKEEE